MYILTPLGKKAQGVDDVGQLMCVLEMCRSFDEILCAFQETALLNVNAATIIQHARIARKLNKHLRTCVDLGFIRLSDECGSSGSMGG